MWCTVKMGKHAVDVERLKNIYLCPRLVSSDDKPGQFNLFSVNIISTMKNVLNKLNTSLHQIDITGISLIC